MLLIVEVSDFFLNFVRSPFNFIIISLSFSPLFYKKDIINKKFKNFSYME